MKREVAMWLVHHQDEEEGVGVCARDLAVVRAAGSRAAGALPGWTIVVPG